MKKQLLYPKISLVSSKQLLIYRRYINRLLKEKPAAVRGNFLPVVNHFLSERRKIIKLAKNHQTPCYLLDIKGLSQSLKDFSQTFQKYLPTSRYFYAVKVNHHPYIIKQAIKYGYDLDVSSARELKLGLKAKAKSFVFSGPGKTVADLQLALQHRDKVIVNLDNFSELKRLGRLTSQQHQTIGAGIRIFTRYHHEWDKFGIALKDLRSFFTEAKKYPYLNLQGIQFHLSMNNSVAPYQNVMADLGKYLKSHFNAKELANLKFIDAGGGFMPAKKEGCRSWDFPGGALLKTAVMAAGQQPTFLHKYFFRSIVDLKHYASGIVLAIKEHLDFLPNCHYYFEPGRIICYNAMHILLKVVDVKSKDKIITDGGSNLIGWEKFEDYYAPIINLTHPAKKEKVCTVFGSLCLPEDLWGDYIFSGKIQEGDYLLVPDQGAMTYSLAQNFIKGIPKVYFLP